MKKTLFATTVVASLLNADMTITDTIVSSKDVGPDSLTKSISLTLQSKDQEEIVKDFESLLKKAKNYSNICRGGEYGVRADYSYDDGKREFDGYVGSMNFNCKFQDSMEFEPFLNDVIAPLESKFKKNISPTRWVVSEELRSKTLLELKLENLKKAEELATIYQDSIMQRRCIVEYISLDNSSQNTLPMTMYRSSDSIASSNIELENPIKQKSSIKVSSSVKFECR